jgi:fluoroacetyl-CoA thioesterase
MAQLTFTVTAADTAIALGSGEIPVLATPRLLAWCEQATLGALDPPAGPAETSVGTRVELEHLAACLEGATVVVTADQVHVDGRLRRFAVSAVSAESAGSNDGAGEVLLGTATITRVVVDSDRFMQRVRARTSA